MNYEEAARRHKEQWLQGKHKGTDIEYVFPYNYFHKDEEFVIEEILIEELEFQEVEEARVNKYMQQIKEGNNLGPSWVTYGKKLRDGYISPFWHMRFYVLDGNHRAKAKELLGYNTIDAVIPKSHLKRYREE